MTTRRTQGYSLLELLAYISVITVLLGVGYAAFYASASNSAGLRRGAEDIVRALRAGELWRNDLREARSVLALETDGTTPTLLLKQAETEIAYRFADDTIFRRAGTGNWSPILTNVKAARFISETRHGVPAWRFELELHPRKKRIDNVRPLFTFAAAPSQPPN